MFRYHYEHIGRVVAVVMVFVLFYYLWDAHKMSAAKQPSTGIGVLGALVSFSAHRFKIKFI